VCVFRVPVGARARRQPDRRGWAMARAEARAPSGAQAAVTGPRGGWLEQVLSLPVVLAAVALASAVFVVRSSDGPRAGPPAALSARAPATDAVPAGALLLVTVDVARLRALGLAELVLPRGRAVAGLGAV